MPFDYYAVTSNMTDDALKLQREIDKLGIDGYIRRSKFNGKNAWFLRFELESATSEPLFFDVYMGRNVSQTLASLRRWKKENKTYSEI